MITPTLLVSGKKILDKNFFLPVIELETAPCKTVTFPMHYGSKHVV
jgi:hypothetical protein